MNRSTTVAALLGAGLAAFCALPASAQIDPGIEDAIVQQGQIEQVLRDQQAQGASPSADDGEIAGEAGVYVLRQNDVFLLGASTAIGYAENPQRTSASAFGNSGGSGYAAAGISAGVQTRLGGSVDFGLRAGLSGVQYFDRQAPSSRSLVLSMASGAQLGDSPLYLGATLFGGKNFDEHFEQGVSFAGGTLALSAGLPLGRRTVLRPGLGVTRQWSGIAENDNTSVSASVSLLHVPAPGVALTLDAGVSRVWFDNFYEDVIFVERNDWQYSAAAGASYALTDWLSASAAVEYQNRDSTFFLSTYHGFEGSLMLTARHRF